MDTPEEPEQEIAPQRAFLSDEVNRLKDAVEALVGKLYLYNERIEDLEAKLAAREEAEEASMAIMHEAVYRVTETAKQDATKFNNVVGFYQNALATVIENFTYPLLRDTLMSANVHNPQEFAGALSKALSLLNKPADLAVVEDISAGEPEEAEEPEQGDARFPREI